MRTLTLMNPTTESMSLIILKKKKALDSKEYDQAKNVITRIFEEDKATELFSYFDLVF